MMSLHIVATNCFTKVSGPRGTPMTTKTVREEGVKGNLTTKVSQLRCGINEAVRHIKDSLLGNSLGRINTVTVVNIGVAK
jgi:hypothetical protein